MKNKGRRHKHGLTRINNCKSSISHLTRPINQMSSKGSGTGKFDKKKWIKRMRGYLKIDKTYMGNTIQSLRELKPNWGFHGEEPFTERVLSRAQSILDKVSIVKLQVFPTSQSSIQLEWQNNLYYIEFEVFDDRIEYLIENKKDDSYKEGLLEESTDFNGWINNILTNNG